VRFSEKKVRNAPLVTANTNVWITSQMMRNMKKAPKVHSGLTVRVLHSKLSGCSLNLTRLIYLLRSTQPPILSN